MFIEKFFLRIWLKVKLVSQVFTNIPCRYYYGNVAGFSNNFHSNKNMKKIRQQIEKDDPKNKLNSECNNSKNLIINGFVKLQSNQDKNNLFEVQKQFRSLINDPEISIGGSNGATRHIINPINHISGIKDLLSDEIINIIRSYYKTNLEVHTVRAWRNNHVSGVDADREDVFSNTFHNDNYHSWGLRLFIVLSDNVSKKSGAFRFYDIKTTKEIVRKFGFLHRNYMLPYVRKFFSSKEKLQYFEGTLGDACICNTQLCLHGAGMPEKGMDRDVIQFEIYPSSNRGTQELIFKNVQDDRKELLSIFS